jgi:hypothetical protein
MTASVWREGFIRVVRAPAIIAGVFALTFVAALPLAFVLRNTIAAHMGRSLAADAAADGVNLDWWQEFASQASGLASTFSPAVIGFAATLDNLSAIADAQPEALTVTLALAVYLLAWTFISAGILDRYARQRPTRSFGFFGAAGAFFGRFVRLAIVAGLVYRVLFASVHTWLLEDAYRWLTRDLAVERTAFLWRVALYAVFGACLLAVNVVFDYARVRLVVEDRRSVFGALRSAIAFVGRYPGSVIGLYALNAATFLLLLAVWALVAPGARGTGPSMWLAFAAAQCYVLARIVLKLQFSASQTALFQARLAHATYAAAPEPRWPESPAAEAIGAVSSTPLR